MLWWWSALCVVTSPRVCVSVCWWQPGRPTVGSFSVCQVCTKPGGGRGRSSTSQNLLTHKWNSQWVATGGSETSDRSELGERPGLGVGGDISWWEEERGKWTNSEAWMLWCVMSGGAMLGPVWHTRALRCSYLGQIRVKEKCIGSSERDTLGYFGGREDPGDFLYIYVVHCHALSSAPAWQGQETQSLQPELT